MPEQEKDQSTETATEQGNNTESATVQPTVKDTESITLSQSELDRLINEKIFKATQKKEKEMQTELAKKQGNWETLYQETQNELNEIKQQKAKAEFQEAVVKEALKLDVMEYVDILQNLPDIETVRLTAKKLKGSIDTIVESRINSRLNTTAPTKNDSVSTHSIENVDTLEAFKEWKKSNGFK